MRTGRTRVALVVALVWCLLAVLLSAARAFQPIHSIYPPAMVLQARTDDVDEQLRTEVSARKPWREP